MAVIGPNADSHAALVGTNGTPPRSITVVEGITRICEDTGPGCQLCRGMSAL